MREQILAGLHILITDDEQDLLDLRQAQLSALGHSSTAFTDPREALDVFITDPYKFGLVMTDYEMGKDALNGLDFALGIRKARSNTPIVLVTGTARHLLEGDMTLIDSYLPKPYLRSGLKTAIHEAQVNARLRA